LFSGDHILDPITPNIAFWGFEWNILQVYFDSLKKVYDMDVNLVLSAHRKVIQDHRKRIEELINHHEERLNEIEAIIQNEWTSVRDTASQMKWALTIKEWGNFPDPQKWFASAEAMSHLEYLYINDRAERCDNEGILKYKGRKTSKLSGLTKRTLKRIIK
jgi:glyoxylase-like metal-dependent hydrolase (beta-lactamase superfamily II)